MIFHVITNFTELGGAESALIKIINHSGDDSVTLVSLMSTSEEMLKKISHRNCNVISLKAKNFLSLIISAFKLRSLIKHKNPNKVFSWMYHANAISAFACLLSRKNVDLFWGVRHSLDDYQGEKISTKLAIQIGKCLNFIPKKVIHCSRKSQLQHEIFGYNAVIKSVYIPNGYHFKELIKRDFSCSKVIIGAAGRFHKAKDYKTLFLAAKSLKYRKLSFELRICGRNMLASNEELKSIILESGLSLTDVTLLGEVTDMVSFYSGIDIFVLSSKTEGFPNVLAEAAAQGCAVFSTDVGDAPYIINNSDHVVAICDAEDLSKRIYDFTRKSIEDKQQIAAATTDHVRKNFSITAIARRFSEL